MLCAKNHLTKQLLFVKLDTRSLLTKIQHNEEIFDKREFLLNRMKNREKIVPVGIDKCNDKRLQGIHSYMFYVLKSIEKSRYLKSHLKFN